MSFNERDARIMNWLDKSAQLERLKKEERELRDAIAAECFDTKKPGSQKLDLGKGYELRAQIKQNVKVETNNGVSGDYTHLGPLLDALPQNIAQLIFKWKPELSMTVYNDLTAAEKELVNQYVTFTDGAPEIKLHIPSQPTAV